MIELKSIILVEAKTMNETILSLNAELGAANVYIF